jgi:hypothetical protein
MAGKKPKLCMFCGGDKSLGKMSMEHFVPKALWDQERPQLTKTVPAHKKCNERFAADNEYFRDVLAMEEGAQGHPQVKRLVAGKLLRKIREQPGSIAKAMKNARIAPVITASGLFVGHKPTFEVEWSRLERVLHNIMRGIYYTAKGAPMTADCTFAAIVADDATVIPFLAIIKTMTGWNDFGDDVFRCRYVTNVDTEGIACLMEFYGYRTFYGMALPADVASSLPPNFRLMFESAVEGAPPAAMLTVFA